MLGRLKTNFYKNNPVFTLTFYIYNKDEKEEILVLFFSMS